MNKFIFDGYYDNILKSFGWQEIKTNIPYINHTSKAIKNAKYAIVCNYSTHSQDTLTDERESMSNHVTTNISFEYLIMYNLTTWTYTIYYFTDNLIQLPICSSTIYTLLHVSL